MARGVLCHKPRESFYDRWIWDEWGRNVIIAQPKDRNIHNKYENWPPGIKTVHSPTPRITDFQQWCKNSLTLGILNRDPPDELLSRLSHQMKWKLNNTVISNIGWWLWGPADILYLEEEVKSWDSCCVLGVTCTLVITVSRWYNIQGLRWMEKCNLI